MPSLKLQIRYEEFCIQRICKTLHTIVRVSKVRNQCQIKKLQFGTEKEPPRLIFKRIFSFAYLDKSRGFTMKDSLNPMIICFIITFIIKPTSGKGLEGILRDHEDINLHPDLEPLITSIILRIRHLKCLAVICDKSYQDVFGSHFFDRIRDTTFFEVLVADGEDLMSPNYDTLSTIRTIRRNSCQTYVILLANGQQVARLFRFGDKYRDMDARANFILLYSERLLEPDLHYLWKKIVNVVFIRKFSPGNGLSSWYELSTVPFPAPIKEVLIPRRLDTWRHGYFYSNTELFRDKTSNLRNQVFRVITFQHVPAAFKMPAPAISGDITLEGTEPIGYTGLEIEVLDTLSSVMNFEPEVYDVSVEEKWGWKQINGSFSGLLGEIISGRADIALGNLYYTPYHLDLLDLTIPYNTQCLTFLTPESLTDNSWQTLILPFRAYMWAGVLIALVTGGTVFLALAKFHRAIEGQVTTTNVLTVKKKLHQFQLTHKNNLNQIKNDELLGLYQFEQPINSFLYTYSMLFLVSLPKLPAGWSLRIFTGWWWIYCILVAVAYRASMISILANPVPRVTIDTIEQLAESSISVGGWGDEIKKFFQTSLDAAGKKIGSKFEVVYDADAAVERVAKGEFAYYENVYFLKHASVHRQILAMEDAARLYANPENSTTETADRNLHIMKDCVLNMPISLGLQKNSPLKPRVDRFLQMIIEAGLVKKWLNDVMATVLIADPSNEEQPIKALMDLKKLYGAFVTLGVGYVLSVLLLSAEILYWEFAIVRNPNYDRYSKTVLKGKKTNKQVNT